MLFILGLTTNYRTDSTRDVAMKRMTEKVAEIPYSLELLKQGTATSSEMQSATSFHELVN